ncbi:uncharacterized protein LOC583882 [Strongylocentrotus purpuratus]|uniref:CUB domain-containing protein n=1 Tax=Strongylocentrotus purpuratus TaxID=7668 RepID=A0A7M7P0Q1_STRPU|nr:uncharacterized protein LOC583882 [Strongylocentrotus purpuratus]
MKISRGSEVVKNRENRVLLLVFPMKTERRVTILLIHYSSGLECRYNMAKSLRGLASFVFMVMSVGLVHAEHSECEDFKDYFSTLVSPDYPDPYPPATRRQWYMEIPEGVQALIRVNALEIERTWDYLTLEHTHQTAHGINVTRFPLVSGNVTSILLPEGNVMLDFCSDEFENFDGFSFDIRTREINNTFDLGCYEPDVETFACASGVQYIHAIARCDRIVDCHDHSDEIGCGDCPPDTSQCEGTDICIHSKFLCDGVFDCPHQDDENCIDSKCPDGCICGEGPYAHFFGPSRAFCAAPGYLPYWTNGTTTWNQEYAMNTTLRTVVIDLHDIPLMHLDPGSFIGATNLNTLDLTNCDIDHLPSGVFDGAPRLYKLYIRNNKLRYLEKGTFRGLYNLYLLFAEFNFLTRFEEGCFEGLTNLFFIDLEFNGITDFRPGTFRDLGGSLERLIITRNNLTSINSSLFYGLEETLLRVNIDNNELKYIEPGTFHNMTILQDM